LGSGLRNSPGRIGFFDALSAKEARTRGLYALHYLTSPTALRVGGRIHECLPVESMMSSTLIPAHQVRPRMTVVPDQLAESFMSVDTEMYKLSQQPRSEADMLVKPFSNFLW